MIAKTEPTVELTLIDDLLDRQQRSTAVEEFSQWHERGETPALESHYRQLMPLSAPADGQQYAFEVDLDSCSGCKACVAACHNLNGLEEDEMWRGVGLLHGGTTQLPVIQHVTSACHHCLEPACLDGCPVEAYEKDPQTGIVRHLDDQCIGCQYCILKCPYDVPKYSKSKGIVRKCDMCHDRLSVGEAPACVQSCPNSAIRITIVNKQQVAEEAEANSFLPGAPDPSYTLPTTVYKSNKTLPRNMLPADYYSAQPQHSHLPLVFMLVLTQVSVGAFVAQQIMSQFGWASAEFFSQVRVVHLFASLLLGFLGMGAAIFHLGRPLYAFRAWIGLRRSWLSREILAFSLFAGFSAIYAAAAWLETMGLGVSSAVRRALGDAAAVCGLLGVVCSIMIYVDTRRPFWNATYTTGKFFGTAIVLGLPVSLLIAVVAALFSTDLTVAQVMSQHGTMLCRAVLVACLAKLAFESLVFVSLGDRSFSPLKRSAKLMTGDLGIVTMKRFFFGVMGGVALPGLLLAESTVAPQGFSVAFVVVVVLLMVVLLLIGEFLERYLFFTAVTAPKMPGAQAD